MSFALSFCCFHSCSSEPWVVSSLTVWQRMVGGSPLPNATASNPGPVHCSWLHTQHRALRSPVSAVTVSNRPSARLHACKGGRQLRSQSPLFNACPPSSDLQAALREFCGAGSTQLLHTWQHRWQNSAHMGHLSAGEPIFTDQRLQPSPPRLQETALLLAPDDVTCTLVHFLLDSIPKGNSRVFHDIQELQVSRSPGQRYRRSSGRWRAPCCARARGSCFAPSLGC